MPIQMFLGKDSKVVPNREVAQHKKQGWTFNPWKTEIQQKVTRRKPRATLKAEPVVEPKTISDLPGPEDFNIDIEE